MVCACFSSSMFAYCSRDIRTFSRFAVSDSSTPGFPYNENKDCIEYGSEQHIAD